ncbi:Gp138 family membrane-puncturing spike protein [Fimbriiglobus ruber]|uniref:Phage-related protein n=1 Tax=Fimbriiglobus ruber TaxID=1908690 RepID=A0A225DRE5_9BACT|nr:Gp138 family membrane-puncturing spike protein [Fimbriiglobus ruber]OWK42204.1 Phage-related protein [Fimbriiglobus ruber]
MSNAPSRNPAGNDTLTGLLNFALFKFLQGVDGCLPARVIAYDPATNRAQVQPLIVQVTTGAEQVACAQVASVPVARWGAGGFLVYFPVASGDKGWLIANDCDISIYKQTGEQSPPNTNRQHDFGDGWFLPDTAVGGATLADPGKCCVQSTDGTTSITMGGGVITLTAPTEIVLDTPLVSIAGQIIGGTNPAYTRTATFNGTVNTTGDVVAGSISLQGHVHSGVTAGGADTGGPV